MNYFLLNKGKREVSLLKNMQIYVSFLTSCLFQLATKPKKRVGVLLFIITLSEYYFIDIRLNVTHTSFTYYGALLLLLMWAISYSHPFFFCNSMTLNISLALHLYHVSKQFPGNTLLRIFWLSATVIIVTPVCPSRS